MQADPTAEVPQSSLGDLTIMNPVVIQDHMDHHRVRVARLELLDRLEQQEIIYHVMASYEIRPIIAEYCPPVHLQQLRKALVSKEEMRRVEGILKQVPARQLPA